MTELGHGALRPIRFLWHEAVVRRLPHGLVHWRYVLPRPPEPFAGQRRMWLRSLPALPRPAWLALEAWLWLRWQIWCGPKSVVRATRRLGPQVRAEEGLGLVRQGWRMGTLSLAYSVPPSEIYRYRLYRRCNRSLVGELVYDHTAAAFHHTRNAGHPASNSSLQLLGDKARQTAEFSALGVPMVPILALVGRGTGDGLEAHLPPGETRFCKPRHGSGGRGAFSASREGDSIVVGTLHGLRLRGRGAAEHWARLLEDDDMLVQPRLAAHPALADLITGDDIVTVRYISERDQGVDGDEASFGCYCASIELPAGRVGEDRRIAYVILEVNALTGAINGFPAQWLSGDAAARYDRVTRRLGQRRVPNWEQVRHGSHLAHAHCPGIAAVAWDWAITPSGPLLLEGNAGWAPATPQMLKGGLLAAKHANSGRPGMRSTAGTRTGNGS